MDQAEALSILYKEQTDHGRHTENQRATVSSIILSLATILAGIMAVDECLNRWDAPFAFAIGGFGLVGLLFTWAYANTFDRHAERMKYYRRSLVEAVDFTENRPAVPRKSPRVRHAWYTLFALVLAGGFAFGVALILNPGSCKDDGESSSRHSARGPSTAAAAPAVQGAGAARPPTRSQRRP